MREWRREFTCYQKVVRCEDIQAMLFGWMEGDGQMGVSNK